jgi:hypothetical protein
MADVIGIVEAVGATAAVAAALWKPMITRHDKKTKRRTADDLFMHGADAVPGLREPVIPAAERLSHVEAGVTKLSADAENINRKLDDHGTKLIDLALDMRSLTLDIRAVGGQITSVAHEVNSNNGSSMRDSTDRIEAEQVRVAAELNDKENK